MLSKFKIKLPFLKLISQTSFVLLIIILDQVTKSFVYYNKIYDYCILQILSISLTINKGIGFGIFNSNNIYVNNSVIILKVTVLLMFTIYTIKNINKKLWPELLIIGGAISNIIDIKNYPGVVDFIVLHYKSYSFPTFNIADCAISLGVFLMIYQTSQLKKNYYEKSYDNK